MKKLQLVHQGLREGRTYFEREKVDAPIAAYFPYRQLEHWNLSLGMPVNTELLTQCIAGIAPSITMNIDELYERRINTPHNIEFHMPLLRFLASKCEHVTEFGTDIGFSTTAFLAARPKVIHCYDLVFPGEFYQVVSARPLETRLILHEMDSRKATIEETDLLFIDSEHTYECLSEELRLHGNRARKIIAMHDIVAFPDIIPAIEEFLSENPHWIVESWSRVQSGMAVLRRSE